MFIFKNNSLLKIDLLDLKYIFFTSMIFISKKLKKKMR